MGRWPGMICRPSGSLSTRVITAALSGSWAAGSARRSSSWSAGRRPAPPGRPLPGDLDELSALLEASLDEEGGRIDLETGEVWHPSTIE